MATTLFIVSFIVLSALIILRAFENRVKVIFLSNLYIKGDVLIERLIGWVSIRYEYFKKVAHIFVFDFIPALLYEMLVKSKDYVARRYYNAGNEFRGRRILRSDGSVSSFLERLSEDSK
ncbi:MAG: hypothetical protein CEO12_621 [Parcubacteria group bacterium Gr01-1014_46]|nr:MAG: hypothetical protein CEO12_621 [Parcubacteria group bacterium Gr01-1014_46]